MERPRGDLFSDHQEPHRNSLSGTSSPWPSADHRPNFSGDHHHNNNNHLDYHHHHNNNHLDYHHQHHGDYDYDQNDNYRHHFHHHHHHQPDHQQYEHYHQHMNSEPNDSFVGGGFRSNGGGVYNSGRKRGFHHPAQGGSPDPTGGGSHAKLYVKPIPRTATEDSIRSLFEEHGNIVEIVLPKDKRTGERQGYCFVKYTTFEEGGRAIAALQDQYTFPGEVAPIKVRFADGERDRFVGQASDKLYVGCLHKQTSEKEIEEIFSPYGVIEDIYILRDELKQIRGSGFVQFSRREMALAAIKALNGNFKMRDCEQPLIVRFADPKKPRTGEPRGNQASGGLNHGPRFQDPAVRPAPHASFSMQQVSTNSQPQAISQWSNQEAAAPCITQQLHPLPSQLSQLPQQSSQLSHQSASEVQKQLHLMHPSIQNLEQQQNSQVTRLEHTRSNPQPIASTATDTAEPQSPHTMTLECDWSEHTCPDGYKYYYNCITFESAWEKPEEFSLFEKQLQEQKKLQCPRPQLHSLSPDCPNQQATQNEEVQLHTHLFHQKLQLQKSSFFASELNNVQVQSKTSPTTGATCA